MAQNHLIILELNPKLRTKQELAAILEVSYSTLWRRIKEQNLALYRRLLDPSSQKRVAKIFGYTLVFENKKSQLK